MTTSDHRAFGKHWDTVGHFELNGVVFGPFWTDKVLTEGEKHHLYQSTVNVFGHGVRMFVNGKEHHYSLGTIPTVIVEGPDEWIDPAVAKEFGR